MTSAWIAAAEQMEAANEARKAAQAEAVAARAVAANAALSEMQLLERAVSEGTRHLTEFMGSSDATDAVRLLAARGSRAHVLFGNEQDGGSYTSVFLYEGGLGEESGYNGLAVAYNEDLQKAPPVRAVTPGQAVHYFAYYGPGRNTPDKVRNIVAWLREELDKIAAIVKVNS